MRSGWSILIALIATAGASPAASAQTKHFTFTVPVKMQDLVPEVEQVEVQCRAYKDSSLQDIIGSGFAIQRPDANGNLSSNFIVSFDADAGKDPASATLYSCFFYLHSGGTASYPGTPQSPPWTATKPGTTLVQEVRGPL